MASKFERFLWDQGKPLLKLFGIFLILQEDVHQEVTEFKIPFWCRRVMVRDFKGGSMMFRDFNKPLNLIVYRNCVCGSITPGYNFECAGRRVTVTHEYTPSNYGFVNDGL